MAKYIFVTGGVVSGLGKGMTAASLARTLKARGIKVSVQKLDPYMNADPGKINPIEHGEVFVLDDGTESDLDLGHYERFIDENLTKYNMTTSGKVYANLLENETNLKYSGKTIQVIPHITDETKRLVYECAKTTKCDVLITEIGGTVGDIEGLAFLEAARQIQVEKGVGNCMFIHVALVPYIRASKEHKSKPVQHSVQRLQSLGISPQVIIARSDDPVGEKVLDKISHFCNIKRDCVIPNVTIEHLYELPLYLHEKGLDTVVCRELKLKGEPNLDSWIQLVDKIKNRDKEVEIAMVGKYVELHDAYLSVIEGLQHAGYENGAKVKIRWVSTLTLNQSNVQQELKSVSGILVPGAFGENGAEGTIIAIEYARKNDIPYFGICFGMQAAVIEFARNVANIAGATSTEFDTKTKTPLVHKLDHPATLKAKVKDGNMRIGAYESDIASDTLMHKIYQSNITKERHRHRYEVNTSYVSQLTQAGLVFSGTYCDGVYIDAIEYPSNKYFVAVQYHPEFKSRPTKPHPLFVSFVVAALHYQSRS